MPRGVAIFDLAETLINSDALWHNAFKDLLEELRIKPEEKLFTIMENHGFDSALSYLMDFYRVPFSHTDLLKKLSHFTMGRFNEEITLKEGAIDFIEKIREAGYATVVLASGNPMIIELTKNHFDRELVMDEWINTREQKKAKNDPELYSTIAKEFGVSLDQCVLFDDLEEVIKSAKNSGLKTVYIGNGVSPNADYSAASFADLMHLEH